MNTAAHYCPQCDDFPGACLDHQPRLGRAVVFPACGNPPPPNCAPAFQLPPGQSWATVTLGPDYKAMYEAALAELEHLRRRFAAQEREAA